MFRKRFNTILKLNNDVNSNIAEKLMAHKKGLDGTYLQPTMEECYNEFVKAIPELTIDDSARKQFEIDDVNREKSELQKKVDQINQMQNDMKEMQFRYHEAKGKPLSDEELDKLARKIKKLNS